MKKQNKGFNLISVLVIVVITSIISALTTGIIVYNNNKVSSTLTYSDLAEDEYLEQFLTVYANILSEYYEDVDTEEMLDRAIAAMMSYLDDSYTTYLNDESTNELLTKLSGEYTGIGIAINTTDKTISKVYDDTPASEAGIVVGDIIIGFNGEDVTEKTASEVVELIKAEDDYFTLELKRGEETITVTLKNETIISPCIEYEMIENTTIGYIYIETFSNTLLTQVKSALAELESAGMTSLIIDLRDNTGGYLDAASNVTSLFTEKGKIIYSLSEKDNVTNYKDETSEHREYDIVILINRNTASASEVMAAALKESYGATIVGETSYGKGKVQQTMQLEDGSMIKYTSAYWLTPNGNCVDGTGITPDYEVANDEIEDEEGNVVAIIDNQLQKAIELLSE